MKKILVISLLVFQGVFTVALAKQNPGNAKVIVQEEVMDLDRIKSELKSLEQVFLDQKLTRREKVNYLGRSNEVLAYMQDLTLNPDQRVEVIKLTINLIASALDVDYASSLIDTVYYDYAKYRGVYNEVIGSLPRDQRDDIIETFGSFDSVEKSRVRKSK